MKKTRGSSLVLALVISAVLIQFAVIYIMQIRNSVPQTHLIDERVRLRYLAHGMTELALLKYQKFPTDFYNAYEYASATGNLSVLKSFTVDAAEFSTLTVEDQPISTFNNTHISLELATMTLATTDKWGVEVLTIRARANYESRRVVASITTDVVRTVRTERNSSLVIPDN